MRIKKGFELRNVCGENIIIAHGLENIDFTKVITLNESAAFLWNKVVDKDFTEQEMVEMLLAEYEVEKQTAEEDVKALVTSWKETGMVD
jgi:hypothetical protein